NQSSDDKVYLVVYSAYYNTAIYSDAHVRSSVGGSINIPSDWVGTEVETFVFAVSNDGVLISNTQYTGYKELT
ncbi:MAG: hypothetical protein KAT68_10740, partial [Bacteroidales bacterium]|nr:hypothetical protein [Bacteroidales bacterium]